MVDASVTRRTVLALVSTLPLAGCSILAGRQFPEDGPEPPAAQATVVETFLDRVHDEEYEAATELFDPTLADELSAEKLATTWADETGDLGSYESVSEWAHDVDDGYDVVYARVSMTRGEYDLRVALDDERRMAGVYIIAVRE